MSRLAPSTEPQLAEMSRGHGTMPPPHGGEEHFGQLLRIEFCRIFVRSEATQRITYHLARAGVAAHPDFLSNELFKVFCQCHLHEGIFPCRRANVNRTTQ